MNKPRRTGTAWEVLVMGYLQERWHLLHRSAPAGRNDAGDLTGAGYIIECKATRAIDLAGGMDEIARVRRALPNEAASHLPGVLIVKRRMHSVADSYAVMTLQDWRDCIL